MQKVKGKRRRLVVVLTLTLLLVIGVLIVFIGFSENNGDGSTDETKVASNFENTKDYSWVKDHVSIVLDNQFGEGIYRVEKDAAILPYNEHYRTVIDELMTELSQGNYNIENPLMIYNPYGTNNLAVNIYFETESAASISYTVTVSDPDIPDYTQTLYAGDDSDYTTTHSYQLIGLVPGFINKVIVTATEEDGTATEYNYTIDMGTVICDTATILQDVAGESDEKLTDGLFVLFGLDKAFKANSFVYDNNGILRADLVINDYRSDRILFIDGKLYYSTDVDEFAVIDRLGRIEQVYSIDGYTMHHDYIYDEAHNSLLVLANSNTEEDSTIEDLIISLNLTTGEVEEVVDMKDLLPEIYETAEMPASGENTYGGSGLDWIHLNSLSLVNEYGDIVVSGREVSTVIYIENIYEAPVIKYMIADEKVYQDTVYSDLVLTKQGDFVNQAGQHTITYVEDENLVSGQYYLIMYNNNYGNSNTRKDFPWDAYPGVGTFEEGDDSQYYKYLVDENTGTYELVESFDVAYSSIVSSVQDVEDNHVTSSGKSNCFAEYDENGVLIKQWNYVSEKYAYRVFKYDFKGVWFQ